MGPCSPFELSVRQAQNLLHKIGQSAEKTTDFVSWFYHIPHMNLKAFRKTLEFIDFFINENKESSVFHIPFNETPTTFFAESLDSSTNSSSQLELEKKLNFFITTGNYWALKEEYSGLIYKDIEAATLAGSALRSTKNTFIASTAIAARSAIKGGMDYQTAIVLSNYFIAKVEHSQSISEVSALQKNMILDYAKRVYRINHQDTDSGTVLAIYRDIQIHLKVKISSRDIAKRIGKNRTYISRHFREKTGKTISEYIQEQKSAEAKYLLQFTSLSIVEIAETLSFSSQPYFHKIFKNITGKTPAEFRLSETNNI